MLNSLPRRRFLGSLAGVVSILSGRKLFADRPEEQTYYVLDPEWGAGTEECPDPHQGSRSCHACNACHHHAQNKVFATAEAADSNRAHDHCKCQVVEGGTLPFGTYTALFGHPDDLRRQHVDRRWREVQAILG